MSLFARDLMELSERLLGACRTRGLRIVTAESCTGGLIAGCLTEIAGSSDVIERGFITYDNAAKREVLGVREESLRAHGAVSERVAREMAEGALVASTAQLALAVTGIAGPGGGSADKPVGLVHLAFARHVGTTHHERRRLPGDRTAVRLATVEIALSRALELVTASSLDAAVDVAIA